MPSRRFDRLFLRAIKFPLTKKDKRLARYLPSRNTIGMLILLGQQQLQIKAKADLKDRIATHEQNERCWHARLEASHRAEGPSNLPIAEEVARVQGNKRFWVDAGVMTRFLEREEGEMRKVEEAWEVWNEGLEGQVAAGVLEAEEDGEGQDGFEVGV